MTEADPNLSLTCPKCGLPVVYETTMRDVHIYRCRRHGLMCLRPDGRFGPAEHDEA